MVVGGYQRNSFSTATPKLRTLHRHYHPITLSFRQSFCFQLVFRKHLHFTSCFLLFCIFMFQATLELFCKWGSTNNSNKITHGSRILLGHFLLPTSEVISHLGLKRDNMYGHICLESTDFLNAGMQKQIITNVTAQKETTYMLQWTTAAISTSIIRPLHHINNPFPPEEYCFSSVCQENLQPTKTGCLPAS